VECFLLRQATTETPNEWWCLVRPGRKLPPGERFSHDSGSFSASVLARDAEGAALVRFEIPSGLCITELANRLGTVPLPPYIHRDSGDDRRALDLERYQTVYANRQRQVAVAAPTAGLHFTPELIKRLSASGIRFADVLLHVGLGTFKPIATPYIEDHPIHTELYEISPETQQDLLLPHPGRRIAVGTTSVRTVEDFLAKQSLPSPLPYLGEASLYLHPPGNFRGIDALITNFHQPRSTLLCLVSAFLCPGSTEGIAWSRELYAEAIAREYRFFSYGDAMLIL
jgi:S-adenosylmethionine:tRNA ribosyltransferase-isomerase